MKRAIIGWVILGFFVVICFFLGVFRDPFKAATVKINTWSPEMREFLESETGMSFPVDKEPVCFEFVRFQDYKIKTAFFMSKAEIVSMLPNDVFAESKQSDFPNNREEETFILSDKDISGNPPIDSAIHGAKKILIVDDYLFRKPQEKPVLFKMEIYLPTSWENVEDSEKVLLVMGFFET